MQNAPESIASVLKEITHADTPPKVMVTKAQQLLATNLLDEATTKSVQEVLKIAQVRVLENTLAKAPESEKDTLINQIIDIYPHGSSRDSFIRLLLDRMVQAENAEQIAVLANKASSVKLKYEYMQEAMLCCFRKTMMAGEGDYQDKDGESYTALADFLVACYRLNCANESSKMRYAQTATRLVACIDEMRAYAVLDEMNKLVIKLEGEQAAFARKKLEQIVQSTSGLCKEMHAWFPFNDFVSSEGGAPLIKFLSTLAAENPVINQLCTDKEIEKIGVRGLKKIGVLKVLLLANSVVKKLFIGKLYQAAYDNEVRALRQLNGCNAPVLISAHYADGVGVIECERIAGIALNKVDPAVSLPVLIETLNTLFSELRNQSICHGDISAENIIRTHEGHLKLLDFEVASVLQDDTCADKHNIKQLFDQLRRLHAGCEA